MCIIKTRNKSVFMDIIILYSTVLRKLKSYNTSEFERKNYEL